MMDGVHWAVSPNYNLLNHSTNVGFQVDINISHSYLTLLAWDKSLGTSMTEKKI